MFSEISRSSFANSNPHESQWCRTEGYFEWWAGQQIVEGVAQVPCHKDLARGGGHQTKHWATKWFCGKLCWGYGVSTTLLPQCWKGETLTPSPIVAGRAQCWEIVPPHSQSQIPWWPLQNPQRFPKESSRESEGPGPILHHLQHDAASIFSHAPVVSWSLPCQRENVSQHVGLKWATPLSCTWPRHRSNLHTGQGCEWLKWPTGNPLCRLNSTKNLRNIQTLNFWQETIQFFPWEICQTLGKTVATQTLTRNWSIFESPPPISGIVPPRHRPQSKRRWMKSLPSIVLEQGTSERTYSINKWKCHVAFNRWNLEGRHVSMPECRMLWVLQKQRVIWLLNAMLLHWYMDSFGQLHPVTHMPTSAHMKRCVHGTHLCGNALGIYQYGPKIFSKNYQLVLVYNIWANNG